MRKFLSALCSIVAVLLIAPNVFAQDKIINADYDRDSRVVKISGTFDYSIDGETVHLMLMKPGADLDKAESGETEIADLAVHIDDARGAEKSFAFDGFKLPSGCTMNDYEIRVSVKNNVYTDCLYVADKSEILALLQNASEENIPLYIEKYNDVLKLDMSSGGIFLSLNEANKQCVYKAVSHKSYASFEVFGSSFNANTVLARLSECVWGETERLLTDNNADLGLDLSGYLGLTQTDRDTVSMKISAKTYETAAALQTAINSAVSEIKGKNNGGGSSGGGGGSSGGKPFIKPSEDIINGNNNKPDTQMPGGFADMDGFDWAKESVGRLTEKGVISGRSETEFAPSDNITRAEAAVMIKRAFSDKLQNGGKAKFWDINGHWAYEYIDTLYSNGIISGVSEDSFAPDLYITRQDFACIAYRIAAGIRGLNMSDARFADDGDISEYAAAAVYSLKEEGIISGTSDNMFCPKEFITRAACAVLTDKLMKFAESVE